MKFACYKALIATMVVSPLPLLRARSPSRLYCHTSTPALPLLSHRLQRIASFIPTTGSSGILADIGCDHALLAASLALSPAHKFDYIYACDRSEAALRHARQQLGHLASSASNPDPNANPRLRFLLGDGLEPLVHTLTLANPSPTPTPNTDPNPNPTHVTLVLSGMGVSALVDILAPEKVEQLERGGFSVQRIVIQPWPPYLLPLSRACHFVANLGRGQGRAGVQEGNNCDGDAEGGFAFEHQAIDVVQGESYVTTSFVRRGAGGDLGGLDEVEVFRRSPLFLRYGVGGSTHTPSTAHPTPSERCAWHAYVAEQRGDLGLRLAGGGGRRGGVDVVARLLKLLSPNP